MTTETPATQGVPSIELGAPELAQKEPLPLLVMHELR